MKTLRNITLLASAMIIIYALIGIFNTDKIANPQQLIKILFCAVIVCVVRLAFAEPIIKGRIRDLEKELKNAALPYCCPGHDFSCPYVSSPYQKSKNCSECENSSDLIKVWVLHNSAWDDKNCPHSVMRYAGAECYMAKIIALKEAKETKKVGIGSCVFVNGIGGYYELVSKVKL